MKCEMKERVLEYLKAENRCGGERGSETGGGADGERVNGGEADDAWREIERHLEDCERCQALVEGFLAGEEAIRLPEAEYGDANLKERVEHYDKGNKRILVFTVVGLILGWFSYRYYITDFLPLKIIIAIPYKVSEMLHVALHDHSFIYLTHSERAMMDAFFPQSYFASVVAEYGVSALIGGAVYGSIGFFTGDKRIFTLTKYLKFAAVWFAVIAVVTGGTFLANHIAVEKNHKFEDISGYVLHYEHGGDGFYPDDIEERGDFYKALDRAFYADGEMREIQRQRDNEGEELIEFYYGDWHTRYMAAWINAGEKYLVSDIGKIYSMSDEFCKLVAEYQEREGFDNEELSNEDHEALSTSAD
ncbi:MAG TPA: hypothetical protein VN381_00105 [Anaerovoracaceae bacterium]|nr:hypothetical protein [Anaerovoracaceae bacterium]